MGIYDDVIIYDADKLDELFDEPKVDHELETLLGQNIKESWINELRVYIAICYDGGETPYDYQLEDDSPIWKQLGGCTLSQTEHHR